MGGRVYVGMRRTVRAKGVVSAALEREKKERGEVGGGKKKSGPGKKWGVEIQTEFSRGGGRGGLPRWWGRRRC